MWTKVKPVVNNWPSRLTSGNSGPGFYYYTYSIHSALLFKNTDKFSPACGKWIPNSQAGKQKWRSLFSFSLFYLCLTIDLLSSPRSLYFPLDIGRNIKLNWETDRKMRRKLLPLVWSGRIQKGKHLEILPAIFATSNEGKTGGERGEIPPSQLGSKGKISSPHACWRRISGRLNQLIRPSCINVLCVWRRQYARYTGETRTRALGLCCVCCKGWTPTEAKNFV